MKDAVEKLQSELEPLEKTDEFLDDSKVIYEQLKEQCDSLDMVLVEYGYCYEETDNGQENNRNNSKDEASSSILTNDEMSDIEITPYLTKYIAKSKRPKVSNADQSNLAVKGIATPVIKSLASALQVETPRMGRSVVDDIPAQNLNHSKYLTVPNMSRK
ncbi:uncharacterized protein LOC105284037 isoform X3 [Ooceraea biroi]|uniref:uncharacterized protein LOC105284037 isoform X3 n=1 Tax=Ooceraea biroi TaxID=2015173 RepID=UPI000F07D23F|nr:uncharacterized protein LOC105284037 isoform X3 [Ooceraea biroi]